MKSHGVLLVGHWHVSCTCRGPMDDLSKKLESVLPSAVGRRPSGFYEKPAKEASPVASFFAKATELEAASVDAFEILRDELAHYGAPTSLLRRIEVARRDEIRHTRAMTRLARKFGARPIVPTIKRPNAVRPIEEIALENAVEGCVRSSFGARVAARQADVAADPEVARVMKKIATDEARHAELSLAIAEWLRSRLSEDSRLRVEVAMNEAMRELAEAPAFSVDGELGRLTGLPEADVRRALLASVEIDLAEARAA